MMKPVILFVALCFSSAGAQIWDTPCPIGTSPQGQTSNPATGHLRAWLCINPDTGAITSPAIIASLPSGMIFLVLSGTCPVGATEVTALNGKMLVGTIAANGNVGTSGGSDTITPTGTISPITAVINHTHAVNITDPGHNHTQNAHTHTVQMQGGTTAATTGTHVMNSTATGGSSRVSASPDQANTATATNNSAATGVTATTSNPAGGVASITPIFSGIPFDPRPTFTRVIFCAAL